MSPTKESVSSDRVLVDMAHIAKAFGRATVLADVNLQVCAGEVHGLLGENGAGKSTHMKILAGVHRPDAGSIRVDGHERSSFSVHAAREEGISMVYQELSLVPQLSVAQNLALGREGPSLVGIVHDDSAEHVGHAGAAAGGGHFSLLIVSKAFCGVSRLKRHQTVLARVNDLLPHPIHALSIKALAPEEFS